MSLDIQSVFTCAYFDRSHDGSSFAVCTGSPTDDEVPRKGSANLPRLALDGSVCLHSFRNLFESVMAQRLTDAFGPGAGAAPPPSTRPPWMHGIVVHGAQAHTAELFRALVLSAVGHALDVSTGDSRAQLQYSLARVYSWGVTDLLNQQRLAEFRQCDWDAEGLRRNVMIPGGGAKLESVLWDACAVPDGHAAVVCTLSSASCVFTMVLLPLLIPGDCFFEKNVRPLFEGIAGGTAIKDRGNFLLRHVLPVPEVSSVAVISCISAEDASGYESYHTCMLGCKTELPCRTVMPSSPQPRIPLKERNLNLQTKLLQKAANTLKGENVERREKVSRQRNDAKSEIAALAKRIEAAKWEEKELNDRLILLRAQVALKEEEMEGRWQTTPKVGEEGQIQEGTMFLEKELDEFMQVKSMVDILMQKIVTDLDKAATHAEAAEDVMVQNVNRVEELLMISEANAASREGALLDKLSRVRLTGYNNIENEKSILVLLSSYKRCIPSIAVLYGKYLRVKVNLLLRSLGNAYSTSSV